MADPVSLEEGIVFRYTPFAHTICRALEGEAEKLGISPRPSIRWEDAELSIVKDPVNGAECLSAAWRDGRGQRVGSLQFNSDGSFFAEHDIVRPHPTDKRWFVEAVTAWGRDNRISTEARLLAMPE